MICPTCYRPRATEADRKAFPPGEGEHLCWRSLFCTAWCEPSPPRVHFAKLHPGAIIPTRATPGSAGLDLHLLRPNRAPLFLRPGERDLVRTGLQVIIPPGHEGQVRPRSGLAGSRGVTVLNAPGTIDADYRGELQVLLINLGGSTVELDPGERIAQLVIAPVAMPEVVVVEPQPEDTERAGGFGSTGRS
jgi:dUTP pyrophosphatase